MESERTSDAVVYFDGVCNFCNGSVNFIIARDPGAQFRFAPLQSDAGRAMLETQGLPTDELSTVVLVEGGRAFTKSDAALRIARRLTAPWPALSVLRFVPRPIRNVVYDLVAKNRYRLFGRRDACMMPTPELRRRFIA